MPRGVSRYDEARLQRRLWSPAVIRPDLRLWWSAQRGPVATATGVSQVDDISYRGLHMAQSTGAQQPAWSQAGLNLRPAVSFSSGLTLISATTVALGSIASFEAAAVLTMTSSTAANGRAFICYTSGGADGIGTASAAFILRHFSNNTLTTYFNGSFIATTAVSLSTPLIFRVSVKGGTCQHYLNGAAGGSGSMTPALGTVSFAVGRNSASSTTDAWNGLVGEQIFVSGTQSDALGRVLDGYLAWEWGLQSNLPGTHPYRNAPPLIGG